MADIDFLALDRATRGMFIINISLIFVINAILIFKIVRENGFLRRPKNLILVSLSIGDLILALFSLLLNALVQFNEAQVGCRTFYLASVYEIFLIHFVYGIGLVVLCIELVVRYKVQSFSYTNNKVLLGVSFSALPWVLGLATVLPLTMIDMDLPSCLARATPTRGWMSVLVPAIAALIASFVVMFVKLSPLSESSQNLSQEPSIYTTTDNRLYSMHNVTHSSVAATQSPIDNRFPSHQNPSPATQLIAPPIYHDQQYPRTENLDPNKEKKVLLAVAIVFFICSVPRVAFSLSDTPMSEVAHAALEYGTIFLSWTRSFIAPSIWLLYRNS